MDVIQPFASPRAWSVAVRGLVAFWEMASPGTVYREGDQPTSSHHTLSPFLGLIYLETVCLVPNGEHNRAGLRLRTTGLSPLVSPVQG